MVSMRREPCGNPRAHCSCFQGGLQIGQTLCPTHKSGMQEDGVEKVRRCILTIPHLHPRSPVSISGHTPTHPDNSVATTIRVGPPPGTRVHMKPHWSGPGMVRALRTLSCPLPDAPHLTAPVPPLNLVDRRMNLLGHCSSWLWRPWRRGSAHVRGRAARFPGKLAGAQLMVG